LRYLQGRQILVCIFPKHEEFFVLRFALLQMAGLRFCTRQPEMSEREQGRHGVKALVGEELFVFSDGLFRMICFLVSFATLGEELEAACEFVGVVSKSAIASCDFPR
jgi:hypothetical protein